MKMKKVHLTLGIAALVLAMTGCGKDYDDAIGYNSMPDCECTWQDKGDQFEDFTDNPFVDTADEPTSTFSVDADGASYAIVRRYINEGINIQPSSVRIEEFLNYFTFDYPSPTDGNTVAINAEVGECPWNKEHYLLRLGIKGKELEANEVPRANFVFMVDVSGSMATSDKLFLLKTGLTKLVDNLNPDDRIAIVTYASKEKLLLESTPVSEAKKIKNAISLLSAGGSTNGSAAMKMAYEEAVKNYKPEYNNRVIMGTDGDFNVGITDRDELVSFVEDYARLGIYMTCLGFGQGNLNDAMMERVSNAGNGTYYYIDSDEEMLKVFVNERERFVNVANDAKCQVTFNPSIVSQYRLIGYENRVMNREDFDDDKKDAGEIAAGQTITALYELVPVSQHPSPNTQHLLATFNFRYKPTLQSESIPLQHQITTAEITDGNTPSDEFYFAAGVATYGMLLRQSPYKGDSTIELARELVRHGLSYDPNGYRAALLKLMDLSFYH